MGRTTLVLGLLYAHAGKAQAVHDDEVPFPPMQYLAGAL